MINKLAILSFFWVLSKIVALETSNYGVLFVDNLILIKNLFKKLEKIRKLMCDVISRPNIDVA